MVKQVHEAQEHYKATKDDAPNLRGQWMIDLAIAQAEKKGQVSSYQYQGDVSQRKSQKGQ